MSFLCCFLPLSLLSFLLTFAAINPAAAAAAIGHPLITSPAASLNIGVVNPAASLYQTIDPRLAQPTVSDIFYLFIFILLVLLIKNSFDILPKSTLFHWSSRSLYLFFIFCPAIAILMFCLWLCFWKLVALSPKICIAIVVSCNCNWTLILHFVACSWQ